MKKLGIILLSLVALVACSKKTEVKNVEINNSVVLEETKADMSEYILLKDSDHVFKEIGGKDVIKLFEEKGSGLVYFGYSSCPFCNRAVPVLNMAGKETGTNIYYVNVQREDFFDSYNQITEKLSSILAKENGDYAFYVPEVVAVKDGEIAGHHVALLEGSDPSQDFSKDQENKLKNIYISLIELLAK